MVADAVLCKGHGVALGRNSGRSSTSNIGALSAICVTCRGTITVISIDAGANRGSFTDAFLLLHEPQRVVLVEAIPELAENLRARYAGDPRLSVVAAALSDRSGEAQFEINRSEASSSLLPIDPRNSEWFARDMSVTRSIQVTDDDAP